MEEQKPNTETEEKKSTTTKKGGLGQGLSALLGSYNPPDETIVPADSPSRMKTSDLTKIDIALIDVNPSQPRTEFEEEALQELAASIKHYGLIQPVTVRKVKNGHYQLIAGERRLRASKLAELKEIPAYIRDASDMEMLEMGLIENIQRKDLNPIEIALSFQRLLEECNIRQEDLAMKVSKSRSVITNYLRLLKLYPSVQASVVAGNITMGHAKMLAAIDDETKQTDILNKIIQEEMSVRQVEELIRKLNRDEYKQKPAKIALPHHFMTIKNSLKKTYNTDIDIKRTLNGKGNILISFKSDDEFERIISLLQK
ncbi:MAG: ParB/RepB/Spo0J family partition protein [Bacteroidales bacterium]|jgi:ParB family chromosome partitioning protein|nr:ParB/RepB/Spo0J family partition protein [Bacteroidales bacterium]